MFQMVTCLRMNNLIFKGMGRGGGIFSLKKKKKKKKKNIFYYIHGQRAYLLVY